MQNQETKKRFEKAFDEYADSLYRYCFFRLGKNKERSEEIVQDCFMKAWKAASEGEEIHNIRAYLYRIAHNLIVNEYRDAKYSESLEELSENAGFEPHSEAKGQEEILEEKMAVELLDKLDSQYKEIMVLRYINDLPVKEIASMLGENENAISVKIHRAIKKLRDLSG